MDTTKMTKRKQPTDRNFVELAKQLVRVPKDEIDRRERQWKKEKGRKASPSSSRDD